MQMAGAQDRFTAPARTREVPVLSIAGADIARIRARAQAVAAVAAAHADAVDRAARFPAEAIAELRQQNVLGIMVPADLGGEDADISTVVDVCYILGRACAATAMIFAMHQIMVACLVRHGRTSSWHCRLLRRLAAEQLLLASSTTDGQGGGDLRASTAAVEHDGARVTLVKSATVVSYGAEADAVVTTARRASDAAPSDQVLVAFLKDDYRLERRLDWDALGMRGTCSAGFALEAHGADEQVLPHPYKAILAHTMMPIAHLTWSAAWTGIAAAAVDRARSFVRNTARKSGGALPPGAAHLTRATTSLRALRTMVAAALQRYATVMAEGGALETIEFQTTLNLLKVNASETAVTIVLGAMRACGLSGYRNDTEFSLGRHLRDILSAPIMINNDRILASTESAALLLELPATLTE